MHQHTHKHAYIYIHTQRGKEKTSGKTSGNNSTEYVHGGPKPLLPGTDAGAWGLGFHSLYSAWKGHPVLVYYYCWASVVC